MAIMLFWSVLARKITLITLSLLSLSLLKKTYLYCFESVWHSMAGGPDKVLLFTDLEVRMRCILRYAVFATTIIRLISLSHLPSDVTELPCTNISKSAQVVPPVLLPLQTVLRLWLLTFLLKLWHMTFLLIFGVHSHQRLYQLFIYRFSFKSAINAVWSACIRLLTLTPPIWHMLCYNENRFGDRMQPYRAPLDMLAHACIIIPLQTFGQFDLFP